MNKKNIVLIGMPSSGKTTVGQLLAASLNLGFTDTDTLVMELANMTPRELVEEKGVEEFHRIQEQAVTGLEQEGYVIATGGSVIFSNASMTHLKRNGMVVYLQTDFSELENRLDQSRHFAKNSQQSLKELYLERIPLYEKYADFTIACTGRTPESVASEIEQILSRMC